MTGQDGMNTFSESRNPCLDVVNVRDGVSVPSSYEIDGLFLQAITALQEASEAASKAHAHEVIRSLNLGHPTTPDQGHVSPFTQRLTLYCGLIATIVEELRSIAPMPPAEAATNSLKAQESEPSSHPKVQPISRSDQFRLPPAIEEPPIGTVLIDSEGDLWKRTWKGWDCFIDDPHHKNWCWTDLADAYPLRIVMTP